MKLAFCVFHYFPYGGLERNCRRFAEIAVARGHEVDVFCMRWEGEQPHGVRIVELGYRGLTNHRRCQHFVRRVQQQIEAQHYDSVVGFNRMPGLDVFYAADICYEQDIRERHGFWYRCLPRYRCYAAFERAIFAKESHTHILSIAQEQKQVYQNYYHTPTARFHDLPPGINPDRKAPKDYEARRLTLRREFKLSDAQCVILFVGSDFKRKGLDRLLLAVAQLPKEHLTQIDIWVVGQRAIASYVKLAKRLALSDQVKFLGPRQDIPSLLWAADMLVHPAYREATGGILLEAIVAGLPVVATQACGFATHIKQAQAGIVVSSTPFMQQELNAALLTLLHEPQRKEHAKNALQYAERTDLYSRAERAIDFIETITKGKTR